MNQECTDVITWLLVFIGWGIVHWATLSRDRRKEKREISIQLCMDITNLKSAAIDFHTASHFNARNSTDLAQQLERIIYRVQMYPLKELKIPSACIISLRRHITRHNIDLTDFKPQPADSNIISDIRNTISDLIILIEATRERVWK